MTDDQPLFDPRGFRGSSRGQAPGGETGRPGNLVAYFVDVCRAFNGADPPKKVRDRMGVEIGRLIKEGIDGRTLRKAIEILVDRGLDPSRLPECVFTAQSQPDIPVGPDRERAARERQALRELLDEHDGRWPTGARFVRSAHAGHCVYDPLGYDPRPHDFPYPRPSREEILKALAT